MTRVRRIERVPYRLALRSTWSSARASLDVRSGWLLRIETDEGKLGFGDCAPLAEIGTETAEIAGRRLAVASRLLCGLSLKGALRRLDCLRDAPAARCGLETALLDLLAQRAGRPLADYLTPGCPRRVGVGAALGSVAAIGPERVRDALAAGHRVLKLKLGLAPLAEELDRIERLSGLLPAGVLWRLDANGAWGAGEAERALAALRDAPIESLEEPLREPTLTGLAGLQGRVPWPIALDESLAGLPLGALLAEPPVRRIVLKPMRLGGLLPALRLAQRCRKAGVETVVTTAIESAVGVWAALHLALATSGTQPLAHGLATGSWLLRDLAAAPEVRAGEMRRLDRPGLGISPAAWFARG